MKFSKLSVLFAVSTALIACGGNSKNPDVTPTPADGLEVGTATAFGDTYSMTSGGVTVEAVSGGSFNGTQPLFISSMEVNGATGYFTALNGAHSDFTGAAAINGSDSYVGLTGTQSAGSSAASYSGSLSIIRPNGTTNSSITIDVDLDASTLSGHNNSNSFTLEGEIDGAAITGTTSYNNAAGEFAGGYYESGSEINGVFAADNDSYAGAFATSAVVAE